jgi:DNA-directed RNA polymerase subunit omega
MARVSIEDCLQYIENRFALVAIASHRTRQLMEGKTPLVRTKNKEAVTALREIAEGMVIGHQPGDAGRTDAVNLIPPSERA